MTVQAPFRFAPINRWIYEPNWGKFVSHDVPFKDGFCGSVEIDIEAMTPVLVGAARRKANIDMPGEIWPFQLSNGQYAIPASSLQGMIRSILEVAGFGRLGEWVDERRVGYRDLGRSTTADAYYKSRMTSKVGREVTQHALAGWLLRVGDRVQIVPCKYARIRLDEIRKLKGLNGPTASLEVNDLLNSKSDAKERYGWFLGNSDSLLNLDKKIHLDRAEPHPHAREAISIRYQRAFAASWAGRTAVDGTLVFTGKPEPGVESGQKKFEFVFFGPNRPNASADQGKPVNITADVWRDFNEIHGEKPGRKENPAWTFWKREFQEDKPIPIFYLFEGGVVTTVMLAFMGKTAMSLSTHDNLKNSSSGHLKPLGGKNDPSISLDLPSLVFGAAATEGSRLGLKRRVSFGLALAKIPENRSIEASSSTVLLGPKPSYFPIYQRQLAGTIRGILPNLGGIQIPHVVSGVPSESSRNAYELGIEHLQPELSGVKLWPALPCDLCAFPNLLPPPPPVRGQRPNFSTLIHLNALPRNTTATSKIRFHNLRPMELGALLWALTFADQAAMSGKLDKVAFRHRLGMGKPYGLGSIRIALKNLKVIFNDPNHPDPVTSVEKLVKAFKDHMTVVYDKARGSIPGKSWESSSQVKALLKAANPNKNGDVLAGYMALGAPNQPGSYVGERALGHFLPLYVDGDEFPRAAVANGVVNNQRPVVPQQRQRVRDRNGTEGYVLQENSRGEVQVKFDYGETEWEPRDQLTYL